MSVTGPFRVLFGVLGGVGVGSGRGASVREKNITRLEALREGPPRGSNRGSKRSRKTPEALRGQGGSDTPSPS